jgi:hypothetical protein
MADYYSVISRAVAALEINTFEDRRAIYNRARAVQAYFNKADFDRERSMLEDAISRVGTEATTKRDSYRATFQRVSGTKQHPSHTDDAASASAFLAQKRASPSLARLTLLPQSAAPHRTPHVLDSFGGSPHSHLPVCQL